ncbi:MAG: hypothetical protein M3Q69_05385 [Acidobacteriota bacterium]|nr:hypothetical protein [Acidobacteriota bacterium]
MRRFKSAVCLSIVLLLSVPCFGADDVRTTRDRSGRDVPPLKRLVRRIVNFFPTTFGDLLGDPRP